MNPTSLGRILERGPVQCRAFCCLWSLSSGILAEMSQFATFSGILRQAEGMNATGILVPSDAVASLGGGKAPLVKVTVNGYTFRGKVAVYGAEHWVGFSAEHRTASGIQAGDAVEVTLELDTEPRTVEVPDDLAAALDTANVREAFDRAAPSRRKEFVCQVTEAKTSATRERRIAKVVADLSPSRFEAE